MADHPVVVVVEDEIVIRWDAAEILRRAGFEVIDATSADAAIDILATRPDIRVVFTDINMPGSMDGLRLAAVVRDRWPPVRIILTSGKYCAGELELPAGEKFMPKPYRAAQLVEAIRAAAA